MKTAILLSGHAREYKSCYPSLRENILDALKPDIYIHSYDGEERNELLEVYKPHSYVFEDENSLSKEVTFKFTTFSYITNPMNQYFMWRKRKLCFELIKQDYDVVIQTRFDCKYLSPITIEKLSMEEYNIPAGGDFEGGIFDMFCISSTKNMQYYFSLFDFLEQYTKDELFHSERLLKKHLIGSGIEINRFEYPIILRKFNSQVNAVDDRIFTI